MGLNWLDKLESGLPGDKSTNTIRKVDTDEKGEKILAEYENLFKKTHTTKDLIIRIQLNKNTKRIQQKGRPVPIHFQTMVRQVLEKLFEKGNLETADKTIENFFVSPAVTTITVKSFALSKTKNNQRSV